MPSVNQLQRLNIGSEWADALNETFQRFGIATAVQQGAFIGQCGHECNNFRTLEENLNYKAETLHKLWPQRFPTMEIANAYAHQPQRIANKVYASRMGNRDESSGDGYRFRGRGCIQLTGSTNYFNAGKAIGIDFWADPDLVATPKYAALTAGWFWDTHKLNALADARDWTKMTKIINGGTIGLDHRIAAINQAIGILG
jgi:putative chitinase